MIVLIILDLEHHFDKGIKALLSRLLEVGRRVVGQFIDATMVLSVLLQEILDSAILVGRFLLDGMPFSGFHFRKGDPDARGGHALIDSTLGMSIS